MTTRSELCSRPGTFGSYRAEIQARLAAATPGKWDGRWAPNGNFGSKETRWPIAVNAKVDYGYPSYARGLVANAFSKEDQALIAHAPTDLAWYDVELSKAMARVERLEAALSECGADYISPPCTAAEGRDYLGQEFVRRMAIAREALEDKPS